MFTFFGQGRSATRADALNAALLDSIRERDVVKQKAELEAFIAREAIDRLNDKLLHRLADFRKVEEERDHLRTLLDEKSVQVAAKEQEINKLLDVVQETMDSQAGKVVPVDRTLKDVGVLTDPVIHVDREAQTEVVPAIRQPASAITSSHPDKATFIGPNSLQPTDASCSEKSKRTASSATLTQGSSDSSISTTVAPCVAFNSPIPQARKATITDAQVIPDLEDDGQTCFSRQFLTQHLGGGSQALIVKIINSKPLSASLNVDSYLCPNLWENPWCPKTPGMSGFMFVGLGAEVERFRTPETHHLFVGVAKGRYMLMGFYEANRVEPLTPEEWKTLPHDMQVKYAETTQRKNKDSRSVYAIRQAYNKGELRVPCVKLNCLDFNENLYCRLKAIQQPSSTVLTRRAKRAEEGGSESSITVPLKLRKIDV